MTDTNETQLRFRDAIARVAGIAATPDGMLTWASADTLAEELLPFLKTFAANELRWTAREFGGAAGVAEGTKWNPYRVVQLLADRADALER